MSGENLYKNVSPVYMMDLVPRVEEVLWSRFETPKYKNVLYYIRKWHDPGEDFNPPNFEIHLKDDGNINLTETLHEMPFDILIKIAIDLGVDTPGFLPMVPEFKNMLKDKNENAYQSFERALRHAHDNPDEAISLANSTLEGIAKTIIDDEAMDIEYNESDTAYKLAQKILKEFKIYPEKQKKADEITRIGSGLLTVSQNIESLRSSKTKSHGKLKGDYVVDDPLWAIFVINSVATVGIFLTSYFEKQFKPLTEENNDTEIEDIDDDVDLSEVPF